MLYDMLMNPGKLTKYALTSGSSVSATSPTDAVQAQISSVMLMFYGKRRIYNNYIRYMGQVIEFSKQPYRADAKAPLPPSDPINNLDFGYSSLKFRDVNHRTLQSLFLTKLALHLFKIKHLKYPYHLDELVSTGILKQVPIDFFSEPNSLKYKLEKDTYVLYSIGPDQVDDGGKPIDDPKKATKENPRARYNPVETSKGDIVQGINVH